MQNDYSKNIYLYNNWINFIGRLKPVRIYVDSSEIVIEQKCKKRVISSDDIESIKTYIGEMPILDIALLTFINALDVVLAYLNVIPIEYHIYVVIGTVMWLLLSMRNVIHIFTADGNSIQLTSVTMAPIKRIRDELINKDMDIKWHQGISREYRIETVLIIIIILSRITILNSKQYSEYNKNLLERNGFITVDTSKNQEDNVGANEFDGGDTDNYEINTMDIQNRNNRYINSRFNYSVAYPDIFSSPVESQNGDGVFMKNNDNTTQLSIWGEYNIWEYNVYNYAKNLVYGDNIDIQDDIIISDKIEGDKYIVTAYSVSNVIVGVQIECEIQNRNTYMKLAKEIILSRE